MAWYFNHEMKRYELAQVRTTKVLDKRFECYPRVWELCQVFLAKLSTNNITNKTDVDTFCADLMGLYQKDGLYYSERVQKEIEKVIDDSRNLDPTEWYAKPVLIGRINGNARYIGILASIKDDLGAYVASAASVLPNPA